MLTVHKKTRKGTKYLRYEVSKRENTKWPKRVVDVPYDTWLHEHLPGRNICFYGRYVYQNAWNQLFYRLMRGLPI